MMAAADEARAVRLRPQRRAQPDGAGVLQPDGKGSRPGGESGVRRRAGTEGVVVARSKGGTPTAGGQPWQRYLAEFIGTFALVFAGCGAVISDTMTKGAVSHVGIALTFGFVVTVMIYALGPISA